MTGPASVHGEGSSENSIDELAEMLDAYDDDLADIPGATPWPTIPAVDAQSEWEELRDWVEELQGRFSHLDHHAIPKCWWRHNEHVEVLVALRDHERSSFSASAPATAPLDWFRALRDVTALLRTWTGELSCGAKHQEPPATPTLETREDWDRFVQADVRRRQDRELAGAFIDG